MAEKEYIEREAAIEEAIDAADEWDGGYDPHRAALIRDGINAIPAAHVRPVVVCRECKHWETGWIPRGVSDGRHYCAPLDLYPSADWFCADGEKREES